MTTSTTSLYTTASAASCPNVVGGNNAQSLCSPAPWTIELTFKFGYALKSRTKYSVQLGKILQDVQSTPYAGLPPAVYTITTGDYDPPWITHYNPWHTQPNVDSQTVCDIVLEFDDAVQAGACEGQCLTVTSSQASIRFSTDGDNVGSVQCSPEFGSSSTAPTKRFYSGMHIVSTTGLTGLTARVVTYPTVNMEGNPDYCNLIIENKAIFELGQTFEGNLKMITFSDLQMKPGSSLVGNFVKGNWSGATGTVAI